jgi:peptidoglycan/LPS O-acetylase OafA/YrhL
LDKSVAPLGRAGVLLFFVHTSFVLMLSMERMHQPAAHLWRVFIARRIFRIYPLSVVAVCLVAAFRVGDFSGVPWKWDGIKAFASNLLLTQNVTLTTARPGPLWTLPYEMEMYICLPVLFILIGKSAKRAAGALLMAAVCIFVLFSVKLPFHIRGLTTLEFVPCFLAGVLAYATRRRGRFSAAIWGVLVPAVALCYWALQRIVCVSGVESVSLDMVLEWLFCISIALALSLFRESAAAGWNRFAHAVAKYSYGIYVWHSPIMCFCFFGLSMPASARWGTFVVLMIGMPVASYHLLEDPLIAFGKRITKRPQAIAAAA